MAGKANIALAKKLGRLAAEGHNISAQQSAATKNLSIAEKERFSDALQKAMLNASPAAGKPKTGGAPSTPGTGGSDVGGIPQVGMGTGIGAMATGLEGAAASAWGLNKAMAALSKMGKVGGAYAEAFKFSVLQIEDFEKGLKRAAAASDNVFGLSLNNLTNQLQDITKESVRYGRGISDNRKTILQFAAATNTKLIPGFEKTLIPLAKQVGLYESMGVSLETSNDIISQLRGNLSLTANQAMKTQGALVSFATATGQSVARVMSDYSQTISSFMDMLDPKRMDQAFMTFQAQARRMNMKANELYGFAQKFDTIDSANEIGGRLNTIFSALGVEFNALALQDMSMEERTKYISEKMNEGLVIARRDFTSHEGRLLVQGLARAGQMSVAQVRAFGAEGAGRLTGTESMLRAGGTIGAMSAEDQVRLAESMTTLNKQVGALTEYGKILAARTLPRAMSKTEYKELAELLDPAKVFTEYPTKLQGAFRKYFKGAYQIDFMDATEEALAGAITKALGTKLTDTEIKTAGTALGKRLGAATGAQAVASFVAAASTKMTAGDLLIGALLGSAAFKKRLAAMGYVAPTVATTGEKPRR